MIVRFFRSHQPLFLFLIPSIAILLWLPVFFNPTQPAALIEMPLYELVMRITMHSVLITNCIAIVLVIIEAFIFNNILERYELLGRSSYMPAFIYTLFFSCNVLLGFLHPLIISMLFFLLSLNLLLSTYRKGSGLSQIFMAGLLLAIASLFFRPFITLIPFLFAAITILRPFMWREWAVAFLGFLLPYIYTLLYYYWTNNIFYFIEKISVYPVFSGNLEISIIQRNYLIALTIAMVGFLVLLGSKGMSSASNTVQFRSVMAVLRWLFLFGYISMFLSVKFDHTAALIAFIPLIFLISSYFLTARRIWIAEILIVTLIVGVVLLNLGVLNNLFT